MIAINATAPTEELSLSAMLFIFFANL